MKITFTAGATSTKVGDKKPTKFYGGETEDIVDSEARYLLDNGFAARPGSKKAKAFLSTMEENPRTRRIDLEARTAAADRALAKKRRGDRSRLDLIGEELNESNRDPDGDNPPAPKGRANNDEDEGDEGEGEGEGED